jgi:transposase
MEKGFLEDCLAQGMSLEAIGKLAGRHPSTVSYWLKKYGFSAVKAKRHSARGPLDKEQLETLIDSGITLHEIARRLDRSVTTIRYWLGRYEIELPRRWRVRPTGNPKRASMQCRHHGATEFVLEGRGFYRCVCCRTEAVARRRRLVKRKLVEEAGGRCVICGYSRCQRALQFHHIDPATKRFHLGDGGHTRSLARSQAEARKCTLLCANCHAEVEAGLIEMPLNSTLVVNPE